MELFIDSYDWVMVPNVYGMSQFADGGLMSTKPYISGSNYLMKMSDYPKGDWQLTWDVLFWRFMDNHRDFFLKNPRLGMLVRTFDKWSESKKESIHQQADAFLSRLEEYALESDFVNTKTQFQTLLNWLNLNFLCKNEKHIAGNWLQLQQ
jgi:deoxyribodipyrimidine photolyase-related protein